MSIKKYKSVAITRVEEIAMHSPTEFAELISCFGLMISGLWVTIPFMETFYFTEWAVGLLIMFCGFIQFHNLIEADRRFGNLIGSLGWLFICGCIIAYGHDGLSLLFASVFLSFSGLSYYRMTKHE